MGQRPLQQGDVAKLVAELFFEPGEARGINQ
jgi:hypothetical protein